MEMELKHHERKECGGIPEMGSAQWSFKMGMMLGWQRNRAEVFEQELVAKKR
jgi:hypothetical protein